MSLLRSRRLGPLFATQALGAVNDNLFKNALVVLVLFHAAAGSAALVAAAGGVFIAPYVLLSATAGQVADRFEKRRAIVAVKLAEVALMALAACGFLLGSTPMLFAVLFGLGVQATFFGPLKYAILPSHLAEGELVAGNGLVEAGTFLGILAGTIAGGALVLLPGGPAIVSAAGLLIAVGGVLAALAIPPAPPGVPGLRIGWNLARETGALLRAARANRPVWLCLLGVSWFWVVGATLLAELPTLARDDLRADGHVVTLMLAFFSVGVGAGSLLCARVLKGQVSARHVPLAALGLSAFILDFALAVGRAHGLADVHAVLSSFAGWRMLADLLLLSACGGLYSVPLYAIIQERSAAAARARMIAANNVVNAAAMAGAAGLAAALALAGMAPATVLLLVALANLAVAGWTVRLAPPGTLRPALRWCLQAFRGVDVAGLRNLPPGQRAIYAVDGQGAMAGCLAAAFLPGSLVLAVDARTARRWWARPFLATVAHVAVDPANPFGALALARVAQGSDRLVVFLGRGAAAPGALVALGMVAGKAGAAVVPARIGSQASRRGFRRLSLTILPPVAIEVDPALRGRARRRAVGIALQGAMEPMGDAAK